MNGHSPIDSLRRLSPVSDAEAAAAFGAGREELLAELTDQPLGHRQHGGQTRRSRRPLVLAVAVVAAAATAAGAWGVLRGSPAHETTSVECVIHGVDAVIPSTSGDPAHDCAVEWKRELGTAAPPLRAYDNGLGGVTVILRSQQPQADWKRLVSGQDVDLIQLQNSLDDYVNGLNSTCLNSTAATDFTRARLAQFGFTGWSVVVQGGGPPATSLPSPKVVPGTKTAPGVTTTPGYRTCVAADLVDPTTESVTLSPGPVAIVPHTVFEKLAVKLRPLTQKCESLPAAIASVRAAANELVPAKPANGYELNTVTDNSMRCASIYETVGGTIFLTLRGPSH